MGIVCSSCASVCTFIGKGIELAVTAVGQLVDIIIGAIFGLLSGICMCLAGWACCCKPKPVTTTETVEEVGSVPKVSYTEKYRTKVAAPFAKKPSEPKVETKAAEVKEPTPTVEKKAEAKEAKAEPAAAKKWFWQR